MDDQDGSEKASISHGKDFQLLGVYHKAIKHYEKRLKIAMEMGDRGGERKAYECLGNAYRSLGAMEKPLSIMKNI